MKSKWIHRTILTALIVLLLAGLGLNIVPPWIRRATAPGQRVHSLAQVALPGGEVLIVVLPTIDRRDGEVAVWWSRNDAPKVQPLIHVMGYPASR